MRFVLIMVMMLIAMGIEAQRVKIQALEEVNFDRKKSKTLKIFMGELPEIPSIVLFHVFKSENSKRLKKSVALMKKIWKVFPQIKLLQVDCEKFLDKCDEMDIEKYPGLQLRYNGNWHIFNEKLSFKAFYRFLSTKFDSSARYIQSYKNFLETKQNLGEKEIFMLYTGTFKGSRFKIFESLKEKINVKFYYTFNRRLKKRLKGHNGDYFLISKHENIKFKDKPSMKNMEHFIFHFRYPNLMRPGKEFITRVFSNENPALIYFTKNDDLEKFKILEKIARKYHNFMIVSVFTISKMEKKDYDFFFESLNLKSSYLPCLRYFVAEGLNIKKYKPKKKKINLKNVSGFLQEIIEGRISPYYKSEKVIIKRKLRSKKKKGRKKRGKSRRILKKVVGGEFLRLFRRIKKNKRVLVVIVYGDLDKNLESRKAVGMLKEVAMKLKRQNEGNLEKKKVRYWMINGELNEVPGINFDTLPMIIKFSDQKVKKYKVLKNITKKNLINFIDPKPKKEAPKAIQEPDIDL